MAKRIFVSFDFDNDKALKEFIVQQARNADSPFFVVDFSLMEAAPEKDWFEKAKAAISRAEVFIIMLGPKTRFAPGVLMEVRLANKLGKVKLQIIGFGKTVVSKEVAAAARNATATATVAALLQY